MTAQDRPHDYLSEAEDVLGRYPYRGAHSPDLITDEAYLLRGCLAALTCIAFLMYEASPPLEEPQKAAPAPVPPPREPSAFLIANSTGAGADHKCRDCIEMGGIGFDCHHLVRGRRLADRCKWCQQRGYEVGQVIPPQS